MKFKQLVSIYEELEKTSSGNEIRRILAELFKNCPKDEIDIVAYLCLGTIDAEYKMPELGLAERMVLKAIAMATAQPEKKVSALFKEKGDLGVVAQQLSLKKENRLSSFFKTETRELSVRDVFNTLRKIAETRGEGSQERKLSIIAELLQHSDGEEAKYIVRLCLGTMRLGIAAMSILDALAIAFTGSKEAKGEIEEAYNLSNDIGLIARTIAAEGLSGIKKIGIKVGRPVKMMLAQRAETLELIQEKIPGELAAEEKYDGERMQIHRSGNSIVIYSRRLENITEQYPDVVESVKKSIKSEEFIIEGEGVAVDREGKLLPFQTVMQRKRKYEIEKYAKEVPVCLFAFDLLYLNGRSYLKSPYPERRKALEGVLKESERVKLARRIVTDNPDRIEEFFFSAIERGCEGIIAKSCSPESVYRAGAREWLWIKWKKDYMNRMQDTLDLVVVGGFAGQGKRAGTYGALLCATYNEKRDRFETICKLGAGLTDEILEELPKKFKNLKVPKKPARVLSEMEADQWFEPKVVVEVVGAEITRSPVHTCAREELGRGLAVRFPRFQNFRENKSAEEATTTSEVIEMFKQELKRVREEEKKCESEEK
ncbi:MAG: ATP-dependent DNA ligase [Candidatus Woesearchaeota archaeon]